MKLLIKETNWSSLKVKSKEVKDFEYDLENMQKGEKVIVSPAGVEKVSNPNLYFILASKHKDKVKLKIGSNMYLNGKNLTRKPISFWVKDGEPLLLNSNTMDSGSNYSISIEK